MAERTFVMIKPDGVQRRLVGEVIRRFEKEGLKIVAAKFMMVPEELAEKHYAVHKGKDFYDGLMGHITSGPVLALVFEGNNVVERVRRMVGNTDPNEAMAGTIRGDYAQSIRKNIVHASDSPETAEHEISLWFNPDELVSYKMSDEEWL
ncbi:MAG TPA: nucleoside-diphosphate kinase [Thermoplasmatales archaeon]|nr:nucleoside-diphosphate kinase [Thermoplasmatales archaeon]